MRPEEIQGKAVTVIGGGRSGLAVSRLLVKAGARVFLTEQGEAPAGLQAALEAIGATYEFGGHTTRALAADFIVISPGVPSTINLVQQALRGGLPVFSEIEVASWFCRAPIVAITGSNGKTTTTSLLGHVFRTAGRRTIVAGNIGFPFSDYVLDTTPRDVVVLEVSSFQLDHVATFRPRVSVLLNITPDHLDRYGNDFSAYAYSKCRIFSNQRGDDVLVYNDDDEVIRDYVGLERRKRAFRALAFSLEKEVEAGAFVRDGALVLRISSHEEVLMQAEQLALRGRHNLYNSLAAAVAARVMEVRNEVVRESLASFEGVPHRLEFVREVDGVRYVNDSKATNVNSVWYALESFDEPIVLIAGGRDKGNDYTPLKPLVRQKVRALIAIGESADKVLHELGPCVAHSMAARSMEDAIRCARVFAQPGDIVLLSPACASFDMFQNYEDRGDTFKRLVASL
ncbi:UDP-N-acetylmuramoyl-L-alanine--D-glutamate ligase [Rhodocaloribacter litoris]|uniref:UDP-N-acetylmuramoyl-L-alanine--D-glutamate ligase n=1 Tax=Rhodocaloribacter litoris TaxID=2558931 RepID=UPI00142395DC|nr:UDP-N-acetylmuramoyl-L-alanine--D-glutamate ligase [Rhodocaloribacter litoris]QXD17079.1 UDP-N-acetylmuramoyl-L-alanine--D-glutamate ligase [Rhodocaloribacter litoris]GIV60097.1 MAG: UDP-N-acetylmuramoylalanine--D-glutamate ligase [Rhodothermaceae bacterium]